MTMEHFLGSMFSNYLQLLIDASLEISGCHVPFENLFQCFNKNSSEILRDLKYFDEMKINLTCQKDFILSDDIKKLLNVLSSAFDSNKGETTLEILTQWKHDNVEVKKTITEKEMLKKL